MTLIEHHSQRHSDEQTANLHKLSILTTDYQAFIDELAASSLVISSSLHGIILAESYGIPAIWLSAPSVDGFKFQDWYHSTGRTNIRPCSSLEEALQSTPPPLPALTDMQKQLIECFPTDLWKE